MLGKRITIVVFFAALATTLAAQRPAYTLTPLQEIEEVVLPALDNAALLAAEQAAYAPDRPPRFAKAIDVDIRPSTHGHWETLPNGDALWRLRITSAGAYSINLGFSVFYMPKGAQLLLYDPEKEYILGPFSDADNEAHNQLWTPVLPGDELVLEVRLPAESREDMQLWLTAVNHDFLNFYGMSTGSCHLDVACDQAEGWGIVDLYRDIIQSVGVYGLGGETLCTGFLVNNTNQDCTPYFMTAYHCEINPGNAPSVVAYWNFQNSYCRQPGSAASGNPGNGSLNNFNTGAIYRAGDGNKDFVLLELDDPIPPSANAFFAGWTREATPPSDTIICIHHPDGAEKRISFAFTESYIGAWGSGNSEVEDGNHIIVPQWTIGSTELGSSGAPLFDRNRRVTGQLHGGAASCSNNGYDSFGWFRSAWNGSSPANRLSDWLDPAGEGVFVLDGKWNAACNITLNVTSSTEEICVPGEALYQINVGEAFTGPVSLSVEGLPDGVEATFGNNPTTPGSTVPLQLYIPSSVNFEGALTFDIKATGLYGSLAIPAELHIVQQQPAAIALSTPANNAIGVSLSPDIEWTTVDNASAYDLQIALDSNFNNLVLNLSNVGQQFLNNAILEEYQQYYLRVRARNLCGLGPWSDVTVFKTAASRCVKGKPNDLPKSISPFASYMAVSSFTDIPTNGTVASIRVRNIKIDHSFVGDLSGYLRSPSGTLRKLFDRPGFPLLPFGCPGPDLRLSFADDASLTAQDFEESCSASSPAISGTYRPSQALSGFIGEPAQGEWELIIVDNFTDDGGKVLDWELDICVTYPNEARVFLPQNPIRGCVNAATESTLFVGAGFDGQVSLLLQGIPSGAEVSLDDYLVPPGSFVQLRLDSFSAMGSHNLALYAGDGNHIHSSTIPINIGDKPSRPNLQIPADQSPIFDSSSPNINFRWSFSARTDSFRLELARDSLFETPILQTTCVQNEYTFSEILEQGRYYWRVIAMNDCGDKHSAVFSFIRQGSVTSTDSKEAPTLRLYPNPVDDQLYIEFDHSSAAQWQLYNAKGQFIRQGSFRQRSTLSTEALPSGLYILRIQADQHQFVRRVVKN
jgi:subtilisin-like proprotein convertase family protein